MIGIHALMNRLKMAEGYEVVACINPVGMPGYEDEVSVPLATVLKLLVWLDPRSPPLPTRADPTALTCNHIAMDPH
jgi:hypothetical protein